MAESLMAMNLDLSRDLRGAFRSLRRAPVLTAVILLTLALGIGVNSALFTLFRLFDRPVPGAGTVVRFEAGEPGQPPRYAPVSYAEYLHLRDGSSTLDAVAASHIRPVVVSTGDRSQVPPLVLGEFVSETYFDLFDVSLLHGRVFTRDETAVPGRDPVAVLSHAFWQQHFARRTDVVGQPITINGLSFVVVGVTAPGFAPPGFNWKADLWLPVTMRGRLFPETSRTTGMEWYDQASEPWLTIAGRLAGRSTISEARAETRVLLGQLNTPNARQLARGIDVTRMTVLGDPGLSSGVARTRMIAMAATAIVLSIVCLNVASLLLARATAARKEIAVRLSLGASRGRLVRQSVVESLLLGVLGGAGGLLLSWWTLRAFLTTAVFSAIGREDLAAVARLHIAPDIQVLAFTLGVSVLGCLLSGVLPAWRATSGDLVPSLKDTAGVMGRDGGRSRLRGGLVVAQAALSLMLLIATGLLLRGIDHVQRVKTTVDANRTLLVTVWMRQARYDAGRARQFYIDLEDRLRGLPGVRAVARTESVPGVEEEELTVRPLDDGASARGPARGFVNSVTPGYFDLIDSPIVRGRAFTEEERRRGDAAVVTESLARRLWTDRDPLGQSVDGPRGAARVVGVARDATNVFGEPRALLYAPHDSSSDADTRGRVLVGVFGDAAVLRSAVQAAAHAVDPAVHMTVETMATLVAGTPAFRMARTASVLAASLGLLGLALASLGVYGMMAFTVTRRTREIGVRIALGANRRDVRLVVLSQGLKLGLAGVVLGLAGGAAVARLLSSMLFGLNPLDPAAYAGGSLLLLVIVFLACLIPARRAVKVDPIVALRYE